MPNDEYEQRGFRWATRRWKEDVYARILCFLMGVFWGVLLAGRFL